MSQLRAIIVDDEAAAQNVLSNLLQMSKSDVELIAVCSDLTEAVEAIKKSKPNLVFLDVQMPDYAGYEIVNFFDEITFEIIFVTAYDEYALKAFELNAVDYIVKPIERYRLNEALEKIQAKLDQADQAKKYQSLLESIQEQNSGNITISELRDGQVNKRILRIKDIIAIEANGSYCRFHMVNESAFLVSKNLKYIESKLPENSSLFRSNRSWFLNMTHVMEFKPASGTVLMTKDLLAKVSRDRIKSFVSELKQD